MSNKNNDILNILTQMKQEEGSDLSDVNYLKQKIESPDIDKNLYSLLINNLESLLTTTYKPYMDDMNSLNSHFIDNINMVTDLKKNDIIKIENEDKYDEPNELLPNEVPNEVPNELPNELLPNDNNDK